jgi:adenosylcobinamide-GDP ribazoletransferase
VRPLFSAIAFLTRLPVGRFADFNAHDVGRSAGWFPTVGCLLGAIYCGLVFLLKGHLPLALVAVLLVLAEAVLTGALHMDGLADSADGFGGGRSAEDVLRIMRDHAIGTYGGLALILLAAFKAVAYEALLRQNNWPQALVVIPALSRWSMLLLTTSLPYARHSPSAADGMGRTAIIWGTLSVLVILVIAAQPRAWFAAVAMVAVTGCFGLYCKRRIGGITGDTLGANLQLSECAGWMVFLWSNQAQ